MSLGVENFYLHFWSLNCAWLHGSPGETCCRYEASGSKLFSNNNFFLNVNKLLHDGLIHLLLRLIVSWKIRDILEAVNGNYILTLNSECILCLQVSIFYSWTHFLHPSLLFMLLFEQFHFIPYKICPGQKITMLLVGQSAVAESGCILLLANRT